MIVNDSIYLKRKNKVYIGPSFRLINNKTESVQLIATLLKNIENLGYTLNSPLIAELLDFDISKIQYFYDNLVSTLKVMVGFHVKYKPMYPNFPKQVMEMHEVELYMNAILHYLGDWVGLRILPKYIKVDRSPLVVFKDLKIISLGTEEDFNQIFYNLLNSKSSLSQIDIKDITWYLKSGNLIESILPEKIYQKETLAFLMSELLKLGKGKSLMKFFANATDVLRLATALSDGDVSLASNTIFRSFKRRERRFLLETLNNCNNITEDMIRHKKKWIRLGERLHPFETKYLYKYPNAVDSFFIIRNNLEFETFNSKVEKNLLSRNVLKVSELLKSRPSEMGRRLDHLLRVSSPYERDNIIGNFYSIVDKVSTPILLQLIAHFNNRNESKELRIFFPKGLVAKSYSIKNKLPLINKWTTKRIVKICRESLINRFMELTSLGLTYIDPILKDYTVPLGQRSASESLVTLSRFSKIEFPEGNTIRFFLWWRDINEERVEKYFDGRVDIDLSAVMYDTDWKYLEHVSYTHLRSSKYQVVHSGDITSAPNGACEFLDLDIDSILKFGGRYVVISLLSYSGQPFDTIPECFAGWMIRENPNSGEIFEPKTVENKVDLTADTKICIPVIIDLLERKVIWTDLALNKNPYWVNNVEGNQRGMVLIGKGITSLNKPDLYELFSLHVRARGKLLKCVNGGVKTIFSLSKGITPFDIEVINSEFL